MRITKAQQEEAKHKVGRVRKVFIYFFSQRCCQCKAQVWLEEMWKITGTFWFYPVYLCRECASTLWDAALILGKKQLSWQKCHMD